MLRHRRGEDDPRDPSNTKRYRSERLFSRFCLFLLGRLNVSPDVLPADVARLLMGEVNTFFVSQFAETCVAECVRVQVDVFIGWKFGVRKGGKFLEEAVDMLSRNSLP